MKISKLITAAVLCCCAGCASLTGPGAPITPFQPASAIDRVIKGMTRDEVAFLLAHKVIVGYEVDPATQAVKPVEASSLYSSEVVSIGGVTYDVDRYLATSSVDGKPVSTNVLTPMVFRSGLLVAKGWEAKELLDKAGK